MKDEATDQKEKPDTKPELGFEFYGFEDTESSDALFSAASEHALGKRPKATQWYQDFKALIYYASFLVAISYLEYRNRNLRADNSKNRVRITNK